MSPKTRSLGTGPARCRQRGAALLVAILAVARMVAQDATPAIVAGDFNAVAWSHTTHRFQRIGNLLDPRVGRGVYPTFPALPWLLRWPIDHVFHTTEFRLAGLEIGPDFGSDHLPVIATLCLAREGG